MYALRTYFLYFSSWRKVQITERDLFGDLRAITGHQKSKFLLYFESSCIVITRSRKLARVITSKSVVKNSVLPTAAIKVTTDQYVNVNCTTCICYFNLREVCFVRCSQDVYLVVQTEHRRFSLPHIVERLG